jgi:uncharacterized protein
MSHFSLHHCSAIITGASSGLGSEFARQLAPQARALLLVARREMELKQLAESLRRPGLDIHLAVADLTTAEGRSALVTAAKRLPAPPNFLINNAGMGDYGSFSSASEEKILQQIQLNITALTLLSHQVIPLLKGPAAICNVSSLASALPIPDLAVYAATKAYVTSLSEALHIELASQQITVTAVCPGPTPTGFSHAAQRSGGPDTNRAGQSMLRIPPEQVVTAALQAVAAGDACIFPGRAVSLCATLFRVMPRWLLRMINTHRHSSTLSASDV